MPSMTECHVVSVVVRVEVSVLLVLMNSIGSVRVVTWLGTAQMQNHFKADTQPRPNPTATAEPPKRNQVLCVERKRGIRNVCGCGH